jgi:hypothetical protein
VQLQPCQLNFVIPNEERNLRLQERKAFSIAQSATIRRKGITSAIPPNFVIPNEERNLRLQEREAFSIAQSATARRKGTASMEFVPSSRAQPQPCHSSFVIPNEERNLRLPEREAFSIAKARPLVGRARLQPCRKHPQSKGL